MKKKYGKIEYKKNINKWVVVECEPHVSIRLKKIFPKIAITKLPPYELNNELDTCTDLEWFMKRYPLEISSKDKNYLTGRRRKFDKNQAEIEKILIPEWKSNEIIGLKEGCKLRNYQSQAVSLTEKVKRLLLVDDIGLGKTYEAIGCALIKGALPAAVVVQTHLQDQWKEKVEEFSNLKAHKITKTSPYNLPKADIYIFKYSQLSGWVDFFATKFFNMAIFDEIQELRRGAESNKGSAGLVLSENVEYVLGTTATPIYNYGIEMYNIMKYIKPQLLGNRYEFIREWCDNNEKIVKNPEALGSYLKENYAMLRRRKKDVYKEVSEVNTITQTVGYDEKTVKDVETLAKQLAIQALSGTFIQRGAATRELEMKARLMTGVSKAKYVAEFIRMIVETGENVIVGGWHRDVYEIWMNELKDLNPVMYTGSETANQKEKSKQDFISGKSKIMFLSLRSGAGIDGLQKVCSTAIIGELDWSPKIHEQLIGRIDRDGQENPVMAIYLISSFGSDPAMVSLLGLKDSQARGITDSSNELIVSKNDKTKLMELVKQFLSEKEILKLKNDNSLQKDCKMI